MPTILGPGFLIAATVMFCVFWTFPSWAIGKLAGFSAKEYWVPTPPVATRKRRWAMWGISSLITFAIIGVGMGTGIHAWWWLAVPTAFTAQYGAYAIARSSATHFRARRQLPYDPVHVAPQYKNDVGALGSGNLEDTTPFARIDDTTANADWFSHLRAQEDHRAHRETFG